MGGFLVGYVFGESRGCRPSAFDPDRPGPNPFEALPVRQRPNPLSGGFLSCLKSAASFFQCG